ncbi:MAG: hypothetical protein ACI4NE_07735 [Succinivibrio sp.]
MFAKASDKTLEREQNILAKLLLLLDSDVKTTEEKAELFYEIGSIYDDLGLETMARFMFMNAIVHKPGYASPYELLGIYFLKEGRIPEAIDAFDSAIELDKEKKSPYPYLNRGVAMYYTAHYALAYEDLQYFFRNKPDDPYRLLMYFFATEKLMGREKALKMLNGKYKAYKESSRPKQWGDLIIAYYLDEISLDALFDSIRSVRTDDDLYQEHLCEAYYYVGKRMLQEGRDKLAYDYFTLCRSTRKFSFLEYRNAYLELKDLESRYQVKKADPVVDSEL